MGSFNKKVNAESAFQNYLLQTYGTIDLSKIEVERKIELAASLDKLFTEEGYEYNFDDSAFKFSFVAKYPGVDFIFFLVEFIVSPPNIAVTVCPSFDLTSGFDLSSGNVEAAREVINEFRNELNTGLFDLSEDNKPTFFAYTDWYGGKEDVPDNRFMHYLLKMPMSVWLTYVNTVLKVAEGSVNIETAKMEIREIRERNRR